MKIVEWGQLNPHDQSLILSRPVNQHQMGVLQQSKQIIATVKAQGDAALNDYNRRLDNAHTEHLKVSEQELQAAQEHISSDLMAAIDMAIDNITVYHRAQTPAVHRVETVPGVVCVRRPRAIETVGLYVPGGSAPLLSTVMMLAIPAKIAGCREAIICTPPDEHCAIDPRLLYTAQRCGIHTIYKVGGAQAIAAMAYGTETVPKVDKIFGPGNAWVTQAKLLVSQDPMGASIDLPAGPSEVLVIADDNANPEFVAADLLSQAEHGTDSQVILLSDSKALLEKVQQALTSQLSQLSRAEIARQSLEHSALILVESIAQAVALSNRYAPEHLILQIDAAETFAEKITAAGAVFVGHWAPETVGDYLSGSNHVLPTYGYARTHSGLSVVDFMTFISFQYVSEAGLKHIGPHAMQLAKTEALTAHRNAVSVRLKAMRS